MNLQNDKIIAEKVCFGEKVKEYEDLIIDDIYTASKKLAIGSIILHSKTKG